MSCQTHLTFLVFLTWLQWDSVFSSVNSSPVLYGCFWAAFYLIWPSANLSSDFITESCEESELWSSRERAQWGGVWMSVRVLTSELTHQEACCMCQRLRHHDCISEGGTESKSELFSCVLYAWLLPPYSAEFWPSSSESPAKLKKLVDVSGQEGSSLCACTTLSSPLWDPLISKWFACFVLPWMRHLCGWVPVW